MISKIAEALKMKFHTVAIVWSDEAPPDALKFKPGKWGCAASLFAQAALGHTAVFDRDTFGCRGGGTGLGFGNQYLGWPGGLDNFFCFLSQGVGGEELVGEFARSERRTFIDNHLHGEGYIKTPELVKKFYETLPIRDVPAKYVIFQPLKDIPEDGEPQVVIFPVNPDQLSALVSLANYERATSDNVIVPFGAGCQQMALFPYREAEAELPRAVIGLTDISARVYTAKALGRDILTFAVPFRMFWEMEGNVAGSFLERETWLRLSRD